MTGKKIQEKLIITSHMEAANSKEEHEEYEGEEILAQHLQEKFDEMTKEIIDMPRNPDLFKNHQLPLARIKKIMKSDQDVRMISSETPVLFAKACEIFIIELTHRAWKFTQQSKRRTLQKSDIAACIQKTQIFDFLIDLIPKEDQKAVKKVEQKPAISDWKYVNKDK